MAIRRLGPLEVAPMGFGSLMLDIEQWALLDATLDQFAPVGASLLPAGQARDVETGT
ncbi:hypothetical protein [Frankia sp. Cas3]|uniref:hypothetical protein n=1 Tax=Frankia sp. Cas3 TaxID=3073926 RepID=UPI002AD45A36|nr:hypothetical protein [Frankia sp. Cas3]